MAEPSGSARRIAYITSRTPWGGGEAFVLDEIVEHIEKGWEVYVFPVRTDVREAVHGKAAAVLPTTVGLGNGDARVRGAMARALRRHPLRVARVLGQVMKASAGNPRALAINVALFPKAVAIAEAVQRLGIGHIHAHWASSPSTCAYVAAELAGVPFSFTSHAWDIFVADNMLVEKVRRAAFSITSTSFNLRYMQRHFPGAPLHKVRVLNPGIRLEGRPEPSAAPPAPREGFRVACVANLVEKKGHTYLIQALEILRASGIAAEVVLVGDGPLRGALEEEARARGVEGAVRMAGARPHQEVLKMLAAGEVDVFALPSLVLDDGQREGLPFALMEALSYGIPVVSTDTAGIAELVEDGRTGFLVEQRSAASLAAALERLALDAGLRRRIGDTGRAVVRERFNLHATAAELRSLITAASAPGAAA
jgi:glycosyltransferase involved in cell wall biosynthesis